MSKCYSIHSALESTEDEQSDGWHRKIRCGKMMVNVQTKIASFMCLAFGLVMMKETAFYESLFWLVISPCQLLIKKPFFHALEISKHTNEDLCNLIFYMINVYMMSNTIVLLPMAYLVEIQGGITWTFVQMQILVPLMWYGMIQRSNKSDSSHYLIKCWLHAWILWILTFISSTWSVICKEQNLHSKILLSTVVMFIIPIVNLFVE